MTDSDGTLLILALVATAIMLIGYGVGYLAGYTRGSEDTYNAVDDYVRGRDR